MKRIVPLVVLVAVFFSLGAGETAFAKGRRRKPAVKKEQVVSRQDTISSVSSGSITVEHQKAVYGAQGKVSYEPVSTTYKILDTTTVEIDGSPSNAGSLQAGMAVSVSSDTTGSGASKESIARTIIAHKASSRKAPDNTADKETGKKGGKSASGKKK